MQSGRGNFFDNIKASDRHDTDIKLFQNVHCEGEKKKKSLSACTAQCAGAVHTKQHDLDDFP